MSRAEKFTSCLMLLRLGQQQGISLLLEQLLLLALKSHLYLIRAAVSGIRQEWRKRRKLNASRTSTSRQTRSFRRRFDERCQRHGFWRCSWHNRLYRSRSLRHEQVRFIARERGDSDRPAVSSGDLPNQQTGRFTPPPPRPRLRKW